MQMVVSVEEACEILGCKRRKLFQLLAEGVLESAPRYGRSLRIFRASVERALMPREGDRRKQRSRKAPELISASDVPL